MADPKYADLPGIVSAFYILVCLSYFNVILCVTDVRVNTIFTFLGIRST